MSTSSRHDNQVGTIRSNQLQDSIAPMDHLQQQQSQQPQPPQPPPRPPQTTPPTTPHTLTPVELMFFGGVSGSVAKTIIAPADNIKILYQVNPQQKFTLRHAFGTATEIAQKHGPRALWRGNSATLLRVFPYASLNYTAHEVYFNMLRDNIPQTLLSPLQQEGAYRFLAGGLAGTTSTLITYPLDVFRARLAASIHAQQPGCSTYMGTIRNIHSTLGLRGIYSGLLPTLMGIFPYNGISFATFHTLKRFYLDRHNEQIDQANTNNNDESGQDKVHLNKLPVAIHLTCGAVAALVGQSLTYPLDVVRRRKQVGAMASMTILQCFKHIYKTEGMYGFFRSLTMNWVKGPIATAVSFVVNDRLKHVAEQHKQTHNGKYFGKI